MQSIFLVFFYFCFLFICIWWRFEKNNQSDFSSIRNELDFLKGEVLIQQEKIIELNAYLSNEIKPELSSVNKLSVKNELNFNGMSNYVTWCLGLISAIAAILALGLIYFTVDRIIKDRKMLLEFRVLAEKYINENSSILVSAADKWMTKNEDTYLTRIASGIISAYLKSEYNLDPIQSNKKTNSTQASYLNSEESYSSGVKESVDIKENTNSENIEIINSMFDLAVKAEGEAENQGYRELIERFGSSEGADIQLRVARAMFNLAVDAEGEAKRQSYRELVERFGLSE
ncbi:hypothetical protein, partial [Pectobacterium brasiliense]|uniref:hypothetical protein n=1 Tax=Pectobacterium brasiliense TaxID=180957 RepID=UPI00058050DB